MNSNNQKWSLENSYLNLPGCFYEKINPSVFKNPKLVYLNSSLLKKLNLEFLSDDLSLVTNYLSGKTNPKNAKPIAQAYAGHQFGHFTMLGDGRAILLGEQKDINNKIYDIQLKGSGRTPFSRNGDGKATLSSMLREYLISESMHSLKIPTSRSLAVIDTGEKVFRESICNGGILTRVASSHIRFGTFEYGNKFCSKIDFQNFIDYTINRHYSDIKNNKSPYLELLKITIKKHIDLVIEWLRVGFIHGVMNTDNMSISGETIDYGPCAFINSYDPKTVFSSIDRHGRYSFGNQHKMAYWNLSVFAGTILQFINKDKNIAIELAQNILNQFPEDFSNKWYKMMFKKIGITNFIEQDKPLINELLRIMESYKADYTNTFVSLTLNKPYKNILFKSNEFKNWHSKWTERIKNEKNSYEIMRVNNPLYIPRNYLVESALENVINGDKQEFDKLINLMSQTYNYDQKNYKYQIVPPDFDKSYKTFCGT